MKKRWLTTFGLISSLLLSSTVACSVWDAPQTSGVIDLTGATQGTWHSLFRGQNGVEAPAVGKILSVTIGGQEYQLIWSSDMQNEAPTTSQNDMINYLAYQFAQANHGDDTMAAWIKSVFSINMHGADAPYVAPQI